MALLCAALIVCLTAAEAVVRLLHPQQLLILRPDVWQPVDTLGWTFRPGIHTQINTGEGEVAVRTDDRGYRVGESGALEADVTVLLLGDSFMAALQVEYEQSFAGLMERELTRELGQPVAVRNTGVGAWDPPHYLLRAKRALLEEPVDLVIVAVYLGNDVVEDWPDYFPPRQPAPRARFRIPRGLSRSEWIDAFARPIDSRLRRVSHLYQFFRVQFEAIRMRLGLTTVYFPDEYLVSEAASGRWENTARILAEIANQADGYGVSTVFFLIPAHFQVDEEALERHVRAFDLDPNQIRIDQPNEILGRSLRSRGLTVLDPLPALREAHAQGVPPYGSVDTHYSAAGHRVTWDFVKDTIRQVLATRIRESGEPFDDK